MVSPFLKLIDLDASVSYRNKEHVGLKYSSACIPPEMFWKDAMTQSVGIRTVKDWSTSAGYDLVTASVPYDMWALGCLLYLLCTGTTLLPCSISDELVSEEDKNVLRTWTDETKRDLLSRIKNAPAKHLVSLLLNKDPSLRPDTDFVLRHPFIAGRSASRPAGVQPRWDVYLSYRADSDSGHAEELYDHLVGKGLSIWYDRRSLEPGQSWEEGFCAGLMSSRCMVCLLSRGAINSPLNDQQNFEKLYEYSGCDNLLLEWRLGLELIDRGLIDGIFPVMIGDAELFGVYSDYFKSGCNPVAPDVVVGSVEKQLHLYLEREGLGLPYKEGLTVKGILAEVLAKQGGFYRGARNAFLNDTVNSIYEMVEQAKAISITASVPSSQHGRGPTTEYSRARSLTA